MQPSNQCFPKTFKPATVDRIHALQKGMKRKNPKLTHASAKCHKARKPFRDYSDAECYVAVKYGRRLDHLT